VFHIRDPAPSFVQWLDGLMSFDMDASHLEENPRSGRPSDAINPSVIAAVEKLIMVDRRTKVLEIVRTMQISRGSVETIIHDHLKMSKVSAWWVPRTSKKPTAQDRVRKLTSSQEFLDLFTSDEDEFVRHIVTVDETWIHHWDPESKQESMQWRHASFLPVRKFKNWKHIHKLARLWRPSFGITKVCCQIKRRWMDSIMPICCWSCSRQSRIKNAEWSLAGAW